MAKLNIDVYIIDDLDDDNVEVNSYPRGRLTLQQLNFLDDGAWPKAVVIDEYFKFFYNESSLTDKIALFEQLFYEPDDKNYKNNI